MGIFEVHYQPQILKQKDSILCFAFLVFLLCALLPGRGLTLLRFLNGLHVVGAQIFHLKGWQNSQTLV